MRRISNRRLLRITGAAVLICIIASVMAVGVIKKRQFQRFRLVNEALSVIKDSGEAERIAVRDLESYEKILIFEENGDIYMMLVSGQKYELFGLELQESDQIRIPGFSD